MKKFMFLAAAAAMLAGTAMADEQSDQELRLEKEAEAFEKSMTSTDPKAIEALRQLEEKTRAARYKYYRQAVEKKGNGILEAVNPPECKYYSTEGVCVWPNTQIGPYPLIAHVNTVLNFRFPKKLGSTTAQFISTYPFKDLGYSIKYVDDAANTVADIYVYDMPKSDTPVSVFNMDAILAEELKRAASDIYQLHPDARFDEDITGANFTDGAKTRFLCFGVEYGTDGFYRQKTVTRCHSFALLFSKNGKFIKIRITQGGGTPKQMGDFIKAFMTDFERKVILDSQTRKRQFEKAKTYPIIFPE